MLGKDIKRVFGAVRGMIPDDLQLDPEFDYEVQIDNEEITIVKPIEVVYSGKYKIKK